MVAKECELTELHETSTVRTTVYGSNTVQVFVQKNLYGTASLMADGGGGQYMFAFIINISQSSAGDERYQVIK